MPPTFFLIAAAVCLLVGLAKGGIASLVLLTTPLFTLVMPVDQAVATTLPLLMIGDVFALAAYWRRWDNALLRITLPPGVVGAVVGTYWLTQLPDEVLRTTLGVLTLVYVGYRLLATRLEVLAYDPPPLAGGAAGLGAGLASALANAGVPPLAAYILLKRPTPTQFVGTVTLYFTVLNIVKLPLYVRSGVLQWAAFAPVIWTVPLIPLGVWAGKRFVDWVRPDVFDAVILAALALTGVLLLI